MLLDLISQEVRMVRARLLLSLLLSGLGSAVILYSVTEAAYLAPEPPGIFSFYFVLACLVYFVYLRVVVRITSQSLSTVVERMRERVIDKVCRAEIWELEGIGTAELCDRLTHQAALISHSAWPIALAMHNAVMLVIASIYVSSLSTVALKCVVLTYGVGGVVYYLRRRRLGVAVRDEARRQVQLLGVLGDVFRGAKEIRMNTERQQQLMADIRGLAHDLQEPPRQINKLSLQNTLTARGYQLLLLASVVFLFRERIAGDGHHLAAVVSAVLFMFGPIGTILTVLPEYERAEQAAQSISAIVQRLGDSATTPSPTGSSPFGSTFRLLEAVDLTFEHHDPSGRSSFRLGPLNLRIHAGQIVFLVGGNGSGKTTLFKLLSSLYSPISGQLLVNGVPVCDDNRWAHRQMLSAIFSDFHLFKKLYGISGNRDQQVTDLLHELGLSGKTKFQDGEFSHLALSSGQRKRLALLVALLEDRPVYLFDEWASDQDPEFRAYYYTKLLPELKRRGKTVLAISHDDRYFSSADQLIHLDYGALRTSSQAGEPARVAQGGG